MTLLQRSQKPDLSEERSEYSPLLGKRTNETPSSGHDELAVKSVELFSDLVVAAVVASLADQLADEIPGITDWLWFWLRVLFVWSLWNNCMYLNDVVDLYGDDATADNAIFFNVFGTVFALACIASALMKGNNVLSSLVYLLGRIMATILVQVETGGPRHDRVAESRYEKFKAAYRFQSMMIPLECLPLLIAILFFHDTPNGILLGGYITFAFYLGWRRYFAQNADSILSDFGGESAKSMFNLDHLRKRYEVITVAVLGGLCFMDQALVDSVLWTKTEKGK